MAKIQPLGDRVLIRVLEAQEKTKGGIVLPDTAKEKPQEGEVVAVGKGRPSDSGHRRGIDTFESLPFSPRVMTSCPSMVNL